MSSASEKTITVNNCPCWVYQPGEVMLQTRPKQLEATGGFVYLTVVELREMLALAEESIEEENPQPLRRLVRDQVLAEAHRQINDLEVRTGLRALDDGPYIISEGE